MANDLEYSLGLDITPFEKAQMQATANTKTFTAEQQKLFAAMDRLTEFQNKAQTARLANFKPEVILQREILGIKQSIANIDGTTTQKLELQLQLEQKILQLEKMISAERAKGSSALGGGAAGGVAAIATAGKEADTALTKVGKSMAKLVDVGNVLKSALSAIGVSMLAPFASDFLARKITGLSKLEEENLAKLDTLSTQVADKQIAAMRARLTNEEAYQLLLGEQERLQQRIADNLGKSTADQVRMKQDQLRLFDVEKESATVLAAIQAESAKRADEDYRNQQKLAADLGKIKAEIAAEEAKSRQAEYDFQQKLAAERLDYVDANFERLTLEAKLTRGITAEEKERLDVLRLQAEQLDTQASIRTLLSLESRTPEEEAALTLLLRQNDTLTAQIAAKEHLTALTNDQAAAEERVGEALGFALGKLQSYVAEWTGFKGTIDTIGRGNSDLSDRELQRKLGGIRSDIAARQIRETGRGALVGIGGTADLMLEGQRAQLQQLQNELRLRDEVRRAADQFGEERAFAMFNLTEQRFADILRGTTEQQRTARETADGIKELNNRLKAGIPVINLSQPTGG